MHMYIILQIEQFILVNIHVYTLAYVYVAKIKEKRVHGFERAERSL